jgi:hypothetical protein
VPIIYKMPSKPTIIWRMSVQGSYRVHYRARDIVHRPAERVAASLRKPASTSILVMLVGLAWKAEEQLITVPESK